MKPKKFYRFLGSLLLLTAFVLSGGNILGQNLEVKIYNTTGQDIENLTVENIDIGNLEKDSSITVLEFPYITFDSGLLYPKITGLMDSVEVRHHSWSRCATERYIQKEGRLELNLGTKVRDGKTYFYMEENLQKEETDKSP